MAFASTRVDARNLTTAEPSFHSSHRGYSIEFSFHVPLSQVLPPATAKDPQLLPVRCVPDSARPVRFSLTLSKGS
jgi:hypothetical protein